MMDNNWIYVKVRPKSNKNVLISIAPGRFEAWIKAKPVEGQANEAVATLIVRHLKVPRGQVHLVKGRRGRHKVFRIS